MIEISPTQDSLSVMKFRDESTEESYTMTNHAVKVQSRLKRKNLDDCMEFMIRQNATVNQRIEGSLIPTESSIKKTLSTSQCCVSCEDSC
jgi:hypothetical protein